MPAKSPTNVLNVVVDQRFKLTADGEAWTYTPPSFSFFEAALNVFDRVRVIGRASSVDAPPPKAKKVTGPGVELLPLPSYVGPFAYLQKRKELRTALSAAARLDGCFLLRIPSQTAFLLAEELDAAQRPYAIELLTDPHDFFAPGVAPHGLAFLFRPYFRSKSRELCARAIAANYVTGSATRRANPPGAHAWADSISDVDLPAEAFLNLSERLPRQANSPIEVVSVGFLDLLYKGQDLLIRAVAQCRTQGLDLKLTFVGDGQQRTRLAKLAADLGIADRVHVTGALGGPDPVREHLRSAHLFALPSRAEGIPRALLEAMAAGLPAIGSRVGAMPDLLDAEWIVQPNSVADLVAKFHAFAESENNWREIGRRNQNKVRTYERNQLSPRRMEFYRAIQELSREAKSPRPASKGYPHAA
jgi:glycosyltransferase involved in cell wall biosynthesis